MPSHADLFRAWCTLRGNPEAVAAAFNLSPEELLDFTHAYADRIAAWRDLLREHASLAALDHQHAAAAKLRETLASDNPIEARRAASALARVAAHMTRSAPSRPTSPAPDAGSDAASPPAEIPPRDRNPADALFIAISRLLSTSTLSSAAAHLAAHLTPDASLDGAPIPTDALHDADLFARLIAASPLARITGRTRRRIWITDELDTSALVVFEYDPEPDHRFFLAARLSRPRKFDPWMIEALTFPKDPPSS